MYRNATDCCMWILYPETLLNAVIGFSSFWVESFFAAAKSLQLCLTLCDPIDGSLPGSPIPGILQARTLEWVATSFSNACMHAKLSQSCPTLQPRRRRLTRLLCPQDCLGKKTGVGSHFLLQLFMLTEAKLHRRYCVLTVVFVCCWSRNEIPQTGWLKQQKFIFSQF